MKTEIANQKVEYKIEDSLNIIRRVLSNHQKPVVACSFGKNSMIVLHMVLQFVPNVTVLFNNTLMEYPDTYIFKRRIVHEWNLNVIETRPLRTFWWVVEHYGFPLFSRKGNHDATKNCCRYLKEYPVEKVLRQYRFDLYFTGLSRYESRLREFSATKYGQYFYSERNKHWKCHPIQNWTETDVWEYHKLFNIPYNGLYDRAAPNGFEVRTACWCCTIPIKYGKIEFLRMHYPDLWELLLKRGLGKAISEKKLGEQLPNHTIRHIIQLRPCFFDQLE